MNVNDIDLIENKAEHQFELWIDGHLAFIDYRLKENKIFLIHTEVPKELGGKGVAAVLVEKALKYIEEHQLKLYARCSYVQAYLKKHPEWNRLAGD